MKPTVKAFFDDETYTVTYVVSDPSGKTCAVIDPVLDFDQASGRTSTVSADRVLDYVHDNGLEVIWILETHAHADHLSAAAYLKSKSNGKTATGSLITGVQATFKEIFKLGNEFLPNGEQFDSLFDEGDLLDLGALKIRVMHTPGHTPSCVTFVVGDAAFVGDTLFMPDYGTARTDFPGGDAATCIDPSNEYWLYPSEPGYFSAMTTRPRVVMSIGGKQRLGSSVLLIFISTKVSPSRLLLIFVISVTANWVCQN